MKSSPSKSNVLNLEKSQMQNLTFALVEVKNDHDWITYQLVG